MRFRWSGLAGRDGLDRWAHAERLSSGGGDGFAMFPHLLAASARERRSWIVVRLDALLGESTVDGMPSARMVSGAGEAARSAVGLHARPRDARMSRPWMSPTAANPGVGGLQYGSEPPERARYRHPGPPGQARPRRARHHLGPCRSPRDHEPPRWLRSDARAMQCHPKPAASPLQVPSGAIRQHSFPAKRPSTCAPFTVRK